MPLFLADPTYAALQATPGRQRARKLAMPGPAPPPWLGPPPFYDSFTDGDGTPLNVHTSDSQHSWSVQPGGSGSNTIQSGKVVGTGGSWISSFVPASADYEVEAQMAMMSVIHNTNWGVMGRASTSASTFYLGFFLAWSGNFFPYLGRVISGGYVELANGNLPVQPTLGTTHAIKLRMAGSQISLYYDGVLVLGPLTNTEITATGVPGLNVAGSTTSTGCLADAITAGPIPPIIRGHVYSQAVNRATTR